MVVENKFAERLAEIKRRNRWSQETLAKKLGISQQMVSKYLKGKRKPKIETVYEIAKKLGTDYLWLYGVERTSIRVEPKDFGRRVRWIRAQNKIGKKEFAEKLGITIETLENMELRDKCPSADVLLDLTKLHPEKDFKWVSTGMSSEELEIDDLPQPIVSFSTAGRDPQGIDTSHYRAVPLLSDAVAAGEPAVNTDVVEEWAWIHASQVKKRTNLVAIRVEGDSMRPLIRDGDIVAIDRDDWRPPGLFAVRVVDEGVTVKRVKLVGKGHLLLVPENREYEERLLTLAKGEELHDVLIGRAVWQWSSLEKL